MRRLRRCWIGVVLVTAALVAAGAWFTFGGRERAVQRGDVVAEGATVIYRTVYLLCGWREQQEETVWPELVGRTREEFMGRHPGWTLVSFGPTRIELERQVEAMCPDMVRYRFITVSDGRVAVYYGRDRGHLLLKELTPVPAERLLPEDRHSLEQGIVVEGDDQVARFLEGLGD